MGSKTTSFYILGLKTNVARANKHCFDDATHLALGAQIGAIFPLRFFAKAEDVPKLIPNFVAVVPEPGCDAVMLVFPSAVPFFPDITKYLCEGNEDVGNLTGCALVTVPHVLKFLDHDNNVVPNWGPKVANSAIPKANLFPLGNVDCAANYDDAELDGLFINASVRTKGGDCGQAVITTNTRVGRGVRIAPATHGGFLDSHMKAVAVPLSVEQVEAFVEKCPGVSQVRLEGLVEYTLPVNDALKDWKGPVSDPIAQVSPQDASPVSTRNTIVPSPIFGATHGMVYHDITGNGLTHVPTPFERPAQMQDVKGAFAKMMYNVIPESDLDINVHYEAAETVYANVVNSAPEFFKPQTEIFTIDQALNGIPAWRVPALDLNKARGVFLGCKLKNRRDLVDNVNGVLVAKPIFAARVNDLIAQFKSGALPVPWVAGNLKNELRDPLKAPRTTRAYSFEHLVATRCFSMHIPAAYCHGRIDNNSMMGADLTGEDGFLLHKRSVAAVKAGKHLNDGDARSFDASENIAVSYPIERIHGRMVHDRFPFLSEACCLAIPMSVRIANLIINDKVYSQWNSILSGNFFTTGHNTGVTSALTIGGAMLAGRPKSVAHDAYGDDFSLEDLPDDSIVKSICAHAKALNVTITPSRKRETEMVNSTPESLVRLKRTCWERNGVVYAPLSVETLAHIGDWVDCKTRADLMTPIVASAAIREWFQHGRVNFENAKACINKRLFEAGLPQNTLSYDDLYIDHLARGPYAYAKVEKQSKSGPGPVTKGAPSVVVVSGDTMRNTQTTSIQGQGVGTVTTPESGTVTQHKLTQYRDDAGMSTSNMTPYVATQVPNPLKPYPPVGIEGIITREYPIGEISWPTAAPSLTSFTPINFPRALYAIPTIKEKLASCKYLRTAVQITARVNGQMACAGSFGFAVIRGGTKTGDPRFEDNHILLNMPHYALSASTSLPVSWQLPWCSENLYDDLPQASADDGCGTVVPFVITPLVWVGSTPPANLIVTIYARLVNPTISGFDIVGGPPAAAKRVLVPVTRESSTRVMGVTKQSSTSDEGFEKSVKGVVDGVTSAVDTVKTVIDTAKALAEVAAFDKPMSLMTAYPNQLVTGSDFTHGEGLNFATTLGLAQDIPASVKDRLVGEESPKPTWEQFVGIPGFIDFITITGSTAAGTLLKEFVVDPCTMYQIFAGAGGTLSMPTPLAYAATTFTLWRGSLKYMISLKCPALQKCTLRITYLPTSTPGGVAIGTDVVGDAMSMVVEVCGDKDIAFRVDFDRPTPYLRCRNGNVVSDFSCNGRIVIQLVTPLSSSVSSVTCPVYGTIYTAAEKGFQLVGYNGPQFYRPTWSTDPSPSLKSLKKVDRKKLKVEKQSAIHDLFGPEFPSIAPSVPRNTTGFVSNDTCVGLCDVMRRPHVNASAGTVQPFLPTPALIPNVVIPDGPFSYFALPFQGYSGSITIHLIPAAGYAANNLLSVSRSLLRDTNAAQAGQAFWCTAINPIKSVVVPWTEAVIYLPLYNSGAQRITPEPYVNNWDNDTPVDIFYYHSANDDFCLYHFVACPYLFNLDA
jgi:hypothetical protein